MDSRSALEFSKGHSHCTELLLTLRLWLLLLTACCQAPDPAGQHLIASPTDAFATPLNFVSFSIADATEPPVPVPPSFAPTPTGMSYGLFLSPSLLASWSTGGSKLGSTLGVFYVGEVSQICGGVIWNSEQR
jgi:hypothetical protein